MPQGIASLLVAAQSEGKQYVDAETGAGTFLDPRVGPGTWVGGTTPTESFVEVAGEKRLRYHLPRIEVCFLVAAHADAEGNVYMKNCCCLTESYEGTANCFPSLLL